jgi:hypothetical protein
VKIETVIDIQYDKLTEKDKEFLEKSVSDVVKKYFDKVLDEQIRGKQK